MLSSVAVGKLWTTREPKLYLQANLGGLSQVNTKGGALPYLNSFENQYVHKLHAFSTFRNHPSRLRCHHLWRDFKQESARSLLCHLHISASSDEDYRSSRNIAISLFKRYRNVIDRGGGDNLKEFINAGVIAYALGCTDEGLRKELNDMMNSGTEIEGLEIYGGGTSLRFKILSEEVHECILWLSIVFITILCTPQPTIVRWSSTLPVSTEIMLQWKGFCALIANAYYVRGMAWLPVKTLQLEQMAVMGSAEEPSVVASRMRLVFSTLEVVSPQWPRV